MEDTATGLLGRRDRLWPTVLVSLLLHGGVVALAMKYRPAAVIDLEQKPIVAKLVRLGEKKPENFLPRKEEAPPEAAAPAPVPIPGAAPAPEIKDTKEPAKVPPPKPAPPAKGGSPRPSTSNALANALNRVRRDKALGEPIYGDPSGDPDGDSSEGSEGDRYLAIVRRELHANYRVPSTLSEKDRMHLKAVVVLTIEPDGRISSHRFESRSGNAIFDDALERAIQQTRLPPPPPELRQRYRNEGLGVRYRAAE